MDKYSGCNIVESRVTVSEKPKNRITRRSRRGLIVRTAAAVAAVGIICAVVFVPLPFFEPIRQALKTVFCYDVFGRSALGSSPLFARIFGA